MRDRLSRFEAAVTGASVLVGAGYLLVRHALADVSRVLTRRMP